MFSLVPVDMVIGLTLVSLAVAFLGSIIGLVRCGIKAGGRHDR